MAQTMVVMGCMITILSFCFLILQTVSAFLVSEFCIVYELLLKKLDATKMLPKRGFLTMYVLSGKMLLDRLS